MSDINSTENELEELEPQTTDKQLLSLLFKEEWRLHRELFNGNRFLFFPIIIMLFTALASYAISLEFMDMLNETSLLLGIQVFVYFFGIQTGSLIFMNNRDNAENLLGEITPFLYTAKLIPTSQKKFVRLFILKDIVYYTALILAPIGIGLYPAFGLQCIPITATLLGLFLLGIGTTTVGVSLYYRYNTLGTIGSLAAILSAIGIGKILFGSILGLTPAAYLFATDYAILGTMIGWILALTLPVIGSFLFTSNTSRTQESYDGNIFREKSRFSPLTRKQIADIRRSSGGFGKVIFSYLIMLVIAIGLLQFLDPLPTNISYTMFFAIVLSMGAFTTYTWINQADSIEEYLILPISLSNLIESKFRLFSLLTILPTSIIILISAIVMQEWFTGLLSLLVVTGLTIYCYSITVAFAGFSPHEFLFDSVRFLGFSAAISIPLIPLLVIALFFPPTNPIIYSVVGMYVVLLGILGFYIMGKTPTIWRKTLNINA